MGFCFLKIKTSLFFHLWLALLRKVLLWAALYFFHWFEEFSSKRELTGKLWEPSKMYDVTTSSLFPRPNPSTLVPSAATKHQLQPPFPSAQICRRIRRSSSPNFPSSTPSPQLQQVPLLKPQATLARKPGGLPSDLLLSTSPNPVPQSGAQLCSRAPWAAFPASLLPSPVDPLIVPCNPSSLWPHAQGGITKTSSNLTSPKSSQYPSL